MVNWKGTCDKPEHVAKAINVGWKEPDPNAV
jgi:hypothetical protein